MRGQGLKKHLTGHQMVPDTAWYLTTHDVSRAGMGGWVEAPKLRPGQAHPGGGDPGAEVFAAPGAAPAVRSCH